MGSRGAFLPQGGFSEPLKYQEVEKIEGVKVWRDPTAQKQSLPQRANTSSAYVGVDSRGVVKQLRAFEKRLPVMDIDFGHSHHHGLAKDDFHVHEYPNGERSNVSRALTSAESGYCRNFTEAKMSKNALEFILAEYEKRGGLLDQFDFEFRNYLFLYAGPYFGYVCEKAEDGLEDYDTEHEYGWNSFEDFLNDTMTEVGMTFREVLATVPAEAVYDLERLM